MCCPSLYLQQSGEFGVSVRDVLSRPFTCSSRVSLESLYGMCCPVPSLYLQQSGEFGVSVRPSLYLQQSGEFGVSVRDVLSRPFTCSSRVSLESLYGMCCPVPLPAAVG